MWNLEEEDSKLLWISVFIIWVVWCSSYT